MKKMDTYEEIMRDSELRKKSVEKLIDFMQQSLKRSFSSKECKELFEVLRCYEVEEGVSLFLPSSKPRDKKRIGKIELAQNNLVLWWGKNRNSTSVFTYSLGVTLEDKKPNEVCYYTREEIAKEFPDFNEIFKEWKEGFVYTVHVYAKAGAFYKVAKEMVGDWLLQKPNALNKSFIPYRAIGKKAGACDFHIFQPKNVREYVRKIKIV